MESLQDFAEYHYLITTRIRRVLAELIVMVEELIVAVELVIRLAPVPGVPLHSSMRRTGVCENPVHPRLDMDKSIVLLI